MNRIILTLLLLLLVTPVQAAGWSNGNLQGGQFIWSNGGGDPYSGTLEYALELAGVTDPYMKNEVLNTVRQHPGGNYGTYTFINGEALGGVMISGHGWVAHNPVAMTSSWRSGVSRNALVWYVTFPNGVQVKLMKAQVCGNWLIEIIGAPQRCPCVLDRGDAC